jgi:hypothetical protein
VQAACCDMHDADMDSCACACLRHGFVARLHRVIFDSIVGRSVLPPVYANRLL